MFRRQRVQITFVAYIIDNRPVLYSFHVYEKSKMANERHVRKIEKYRKRENERQERNIYTYIHYIHVCMYLYIYVNTYISVDLGNSSLDPSAELLPCGRSGSSDPEHNYRDDKGSEHSNNNRPK